LQNITHNYSYSLFRSLETCPSRSCYFWACCTLSNKVLLKISDRESKEIKEEEERQKVKKEKEKVEFG
jgi:hypothetical protein